MSETSASSRSRLGTLFIAPGRGSVSGPVGRVERRIDNDTVQLLAAAGFSSASRIDQLWGAAWRWLQCCWLADSDADVPSQATCSSWLNECARTTSDADGEALRWSSRFDSGLSVILEFDTALLDAAQASTVFDGALRIAVQLVRRPSAALGDLELLDARDRERQFHVWNTPLQSNGPCPSIMHFFSAMVERASDAHAVQMRGQCLTYRELEQRASRIAGGLWHAGVRPGDRVGVSLDRGPDRIAALLGILRCGAAYVPMDMQYPAERLAFIAADAAVGIAIHAGHRPADLPFARKLLAIEDLLAAAPIERDADGVEGDSVAYVMYTSGSTGTPKGIAIRHRSIVRLVIDAGYVMLAGAVVLHAAPLGFDASTLEIWGPLLNGGCCVLHDEALPTPAGLARTIRTGQVTTAWLTAALFNAVVDEDPRHLEGLQQLLIGGEALSMPHVRRALAALPGLALINGYGPTECTTFATTYRIPHDLGDDARSVPIGRPITATQAYVLGPTLRPLPSGLVGELFLGGSGLALGYLNQDELTAARFVAHPFSGPGERLYRTGDRVRHLPDGNIEFIGRADAQVKIRGFRIELGEIESTLARHPSVRSCAVSAPPEDGSLSRLVAYVVPSGERVPFGLLREHLAAHLPEYMLPATWIWLDALPITVNGKLDRRSLPPPPSTRPPIRSEFEAPDGTIEHAICDMFAAALKIDAVGRHDNFFELGGNSLLVLRIIAKVRDSLHMDLSTSAFLRLPTPAAIARELTGAGLAAAEGRRFARRPAAGNEPIAIIGMAGRFPGAADIEEFWANLCAGRDGIRHFQDHELDPSLPGSLTSDAGYVKARGVIDGVDLFDAAFFGITPREAELMDPQQRVFLELCWHALEHSGHAPDAADGSVGVYAGMHNATYFQNHVLRNAGRVEAFGEFQAMLANEKDYIATRIANRLDLTGPAISMNTACSTSLVAIAQAVIGLRSGQCDLALAGGSSIHCPPRSGYLHQEGSILSPDGRTRTFDAAAAGTVFSDGAAVVVLKRLADAIADGDTIHALIRGVAVNNDGRDKASFTAPSSVGQEAVIVAALRDAAVDARTVSYVEAHGTATPMGDPIEIEGLTRAFRRSTADVGFCRIGSLKSNVGHLVIAAGAAGVIKAALSMARDQLPPSIHFDRPHPAIDFASSPFVVNAELSPWPPGPAPRRAGVSAFGIGGTNAHVILEEAPQAPPRPRDEGDHVLQVSARTPAALESMAAQLADHLAAQPRLALADVAHTLRAGRSRFPERLVVRARSLQEAVSGLRGTNGARRSVGRAMVPSPALVWMFSGQGSQYAGMGRSLHVGDPAFRDAFDEASSEMQRWLDFDLARRMFSGDAATDTGFIQPALFCLEYALARSWQAKGAVPSALIGHSLGEFSAAVIAEVMSMPDAARLVARRAALMQVQPPGRMMSVLLPASALLPLLPPGLSLAAENGPKACVVAGPADTIEACAADYVARGIAARVLHTSHAFHSALMDAAVAPFEAEVRQVRLRPTTIPMVSTVTGDWLTEAQACAPEYWARQLREPVRFSSAVQRARERRSSLFVEVGPRATLAGLARQQACASLASLADTPEQEVDRFAMAQAELWALGYELPVDDPVGTRRRRVPLPGYAFDRKRYWLDSRVEPAPRSTPASTPMPATPVTPAPAQPSDHARLPRLVERVRAALEDVAGVDLQQADGATDLLQLGLDSLSLTQAALQMKRQFGVAVTFRQMMERFRSIDALARHLDESLPAEPAAAAAAAPALPATSSMPPSAIVPSASIPAPMPALLHEVLQQQMHLMAQQLELLRGASASPEQHTRTASTASPPTATAAKDEASATARTTSEETEKPVGYDVKKAFGAIARIHTQSGTTTERQRARLEAFVKRYIERTSRSKAYTATHRPHLADPRVVNGFRPTTKEIVYQIVVERSKGSRMWDLDGNEYVDVLNGFGMNLFGWQPDFINDAVREQLDRGYDIGPQHPLAGEVAQMVCEMTGLDRAGLCNTGSEAVMAAVRIARTCTGRNMLVVFSGSYHGTFDEVVVRAGRGAKGIPAAPGIMPGMFGDVRVLDYGSPEALDFIRSNASDIAAVLCEAVQSRRPDFRPISFLKEVREITAQSGSCLIFDEVITGFRVHPGGVQALFDIHADLVCYGKVVGGGMPIGVVAGKREFMDALDGGAWAYGDTSMPTVGVTYFAGTFVRHPLALAAAKASLRHLKERGPSLQSSLNALTGAFADELNAYCRSVGAPLEIRHFGSLWRVAWTEDHPFQDLLFAMMRSRGVHILDNFPCFMTTAHTATDIAVIKSAFRESIAELQEADFLPRRADMPLAVDASKPPVPGARLGRGPDGRPQWFIPNPEKPGSFIAVS